uniref:Zinc finger, CCHC-type n=1 Tax=Tanacetum cinerariifolium TaxID=118510 RepID=A0A6L2M5E5_TANCI|nr:zinc finger, CCHC-type [Tanacetum cinerariifolium]
MGMGGDGFHIKQTASEEEVVHVLMGLGTKLRDYINEFNKLILDLVNIDIEIDDEDQAFMLLTSLPSSYENLMDTLLYGRESLTMKGKSNHLGKAHSRGSSRFNLRCGTEALGVIENGEMTELVMDLGGSYHMKPRRDFLYDFKGFDGASIQLGDNRTCAIRGTGKAQIQFHYGSSIILKDVSGSKTMKDKQLEEKTNRNSLVKEHENVHLAIFLHMNESLMGTRMIRKRPFIEGDGWEPKWL